MELSYEWKGKNTVNMQPLGYGVYYIGIVVPQYVLRLLGLANATNFKGWYSMNPKQCSYWL
jgi:hypothetical protein